MTTGRTERVDRTVVELDKPLMAAIRARAKREQRTLRGQMTIILAEWLAEHGDLPRDPQAAQ